VTIKMNTKGYGGRTMSKYAQVYTNDPVKKVITLTLTFPVEKFADIKPTLLRMNGPSGIPMKKTIEIVPSEKTPFKITGSSARDGRYIRFEVKDTMISGRPGYVIEVENTRTDPGAYQDIIYLDTDSKVQPQLSIRVYGNIYDRNLIENTRPQQAPAPEPKPAPVPSGDENAGH